MGIWTPPRRDSRTLSQYDFTELTLINGVTLAGEWTFESDGSIGVFPRFVSTTGQVVFLHAVAHAKEKKP